MIEYKFSDYGFFYTFMDTPPEFFYDGYKKEIFFTKATNDALHLYISLRRINSTIDQARTDLLQKTALCYLNDDERCKLVDYEQKELELRLYLTKDEEDIFCCAGVDTYFDGAKQYVLLRMHVDEAYKLAELKSYCGKKEKTND